jgi:hypothetical protein
VGGPLPLFEIYQSELALEPGSGAAPDRARLLGFRAWAERSPAKHVGSGAAVRVMDLEVSEMPEETGR